MPEKIIPTQPNAPMEALFKSVFKTRKAAQAAGKAALVSILTPGQWSALNWARKKQGNTRQNNGRPAGELAQPWASPSEFTEAALKEAVGKIAREEINAGHPVPDYVAAWLNAGEKL